MMLPPPGETIQIRNHTSTVIKDLYYTYADYSEQKIKKIHSDTKESFFIATANLKDDHDLILYFKSQPQRLFTFPNAVKKKRELFNYSYFFLKIVETEDGIQIVEDPEGEKEFHSANS